MSVNVGTAVAYLELDASAFNTGMANVQSSLSNYQSGFSTAMTGVGSALTATGTALTTGLTVPIANAAKEMVTFGADFDKQMSAVRAVMGNISDEEFEALRNAAIGWGEKTVYTATEAGEALYYMGLAGWDAEQAINGLGSVLNLAAAGQMDLGRASDVVTDSMTAMNLKAGEYTNGIENTAYYTSVLAAVMANSNTDVDMLGESFKYVAPIAGQLGFTIEDLGIALGLAANAGIKSSQAGTSLRQAFKQLISPTDKTQAAMEKYGISLYDATGKALPLRQIMLQLQQTFGDLGVEVIDTNGELKDGEAVMQEYANSLPLTQQEKLKAVVDLFGTRAMPTMLAIIQQAGGEFDKLSGAIDDAANTGEYASDMAHTQMDNLAGDWTRFTSALGTTKIMLQDLINGTLREFVQQLTELVKQFNALDDSQKKTILKWGAIAAAVGPVMTVFGRLMLTIGQIAPMFAAFSSKIGGVVSGLTGASAAAEGTASGLGGIISKIGSLGAKANWIIAIILAVINAIVDLWRKSEEFRSWVKQAISKAVEIIKTIWGFLKKIIDVVAELWQSIVEAIEPLVAVLIKVLAPALDAVLSVLKPIFEILSPILQLVGKLIQQIVAIVQVIFTLLSPVVEFISDLVTNAVNIIGRGLQIVSNLITPVLEWIVDRVGWVVDKIVQFCEWLKYQLVGDPIIIDLIEAIKTVFEAGLNFVINVVQFFVDKVVEFFSWLKEKASEITQNLIDGIKVLWSNLKDWFVDAWGKFTAWISDAWETLKAKASQAFDNFIQMAKAFLQNILDTAREILNTILDVAKNVWNSIVSAFDTAKQHIQDGIHAIRNKFDELKEAIKQKFEEIKENIQQKFEEVREKLENLGVMMREKFSAIVNDLKQHFANIMDKIKEFGTKFVDAWKNAFSNVKQGIAQVFNNIRTGFTDFARNVASVAKNVGYSFIQGLLGTGRNIKDFFVNFIKTAVEGLMSALKTFKEIGGLIMQNLWDGIKQKWSQFVEWLGKAWESFLNGQVFTSLWDKIKGAFGNLTSSSSSKKKVNGSHADGLAYVPFNGYIAELHKGERVLTAQENQKYSNVGGGTTNINFYSNERIDEYTAARELRRTVHDIELGLV